MTSEPEGPAQPRPWPLTSLQAARTGQAQQGWSDEELLHRLLLVLRRSPLAEVAAVRERTEQDLAALASTGPEGSDVTARIELVAGRLPTYAGRFASTILTDELVAAPTLPALPPAPPGPTAYDRPLRPRQVVLLLGATVLGMALLAVVLVLLGI